MSIITHNFVPDLRFNISSKPTAIGHSVLNATIFKLNPKQIRFFFFLIRVIMGRRKKYYCFIIYCAPRIVDLTND